MLRDLNLNEMNLVSGGFANDELPTGGIELWDKDSDRSGSGMVPEGGDHGAITHNSLWSVQSSNLGQALGGWDNEGSAQSSIFGDGTITIDCCSITLLGITVDVDVFEVTIPPGTNNYHPNNPKNWQ